MLISFEHRFIFLKTRKVAGTSVEAGLRKIMGENDVIACVTPRDEYYSVERGDYSRNWAEYKSDETVYTQFILSKRFEEAAAFLGIIKKKYVSHMSFQQISKRLAKENLSIKDFFVFTIDRNPYDYMISSVLYNNKAYNANRLDIDDNINISSLIQKRLSNSNFLSRLNYKMYTNSDNKILVNKVIKYETLKPELNLIMKSFGVNPNLIILPELKVNKRSTDYISQIKDDVKILIQDKFDFVFRNLGYQKLI